MVQTHLANESQFKCQRCGACCRLVGLSDVPEIKAMAREDSDACRYLMPDNLCSIYEERPIFCQVDGMYDQYVKEQGITREEWYIKNAKACMYLRNILGVTNK